MTEYELTLNGNKIGIVVNEGGGYIKYNDLDYEICPHCSERDCCFGCAGSRVTDAEDEGDVQARLKYNGLLEGLESLLLAHACAGVDIAAPAYVAGVETMLEAAVNNL